jgi:glycosyltransferase involved in cell wall biosynthesis
MRVTIQYEVSSSGKSKFIQRLIPALEKIGVNIVKKKPDVTLGLSYWKRKPEGKTVIRVDGVHIEKDSKHSWRRKMIRKAIKNSDGVIYQSDFARYMVGSILRVSGKKEFVIFNGANPEDYKIKSIKSEYPKNVIISGRYVSTKVRLHKRMKETIQIAENYVKKHPDVCFWFCGKKREEMKTSKQLRYLDDIPELILRLYLVMADVMINISWFSWCDNAVVEALVAGTPVISGNLGGNVEIIKNCGVILPLDKEEIKAKLQKNIPPKIDYKLVENALDKIFNEPMKPVRPEYIYIDTIAKQYKAAFEKVLG